MGLHLTYVNGRGLMIKFKHLKLILLFLLLAGCKPSEHIPGSLDSSNSTQAAGPATSPTSSASSVYVDSALQASALQILQVNCGGCHGSTSGSGGVSDILNVGHLIAAGLIVPGNATQGLIIADVTSGKMPVGGSALSSTDQTTLKNWIASMNTSGVGVLIAGTGGTSTPPPPIAPPPSPNSVFVDANLQTKALQVLQVNCSGCHGGANGLGGVTDILNVSHLISSGLIVPGNSTAGSIIADVTSGKMPLGGTALITTDVDALKNWIASMNTNGVGVPAVGIGAPMAIALGPTWTSLSANVFRPKCQSCHGAAAAHDGISYDTYAKALATGGIKPGSHQQSEVYAATSSGSMPQSSYPKLTTDELQALAQWIDAGALNN